MHLLDTRSLELRHYVTREAVIEPYAILSHTWGDDEVSFQQIQKLESKQSKGYKQIVECCTEAASEGYQYVWIDTCCIDKTSSAELSEAVNTMYNWYRNADLCLVFLSDMTIDHDETIKDGRFRQSRWFRRGWTLQELLASDNLIFYDADWKRIGSKRELLSQIFFATGIDRMYLDRSKPPWEASVATRMSWAAYRRTTRPEDEAYCLMGLFDVNMPMLYGEGRKAFVRLHHEIARATDDESLFAWHRR